MSFVVCIFFVFILLAGCEGPSHASPAQPLLPVLLLSSLSAFLFYSFPKAIRDRLNRAKGIVRYISIIVIVLLIPLIVFVVSITALLFAGVVLGLGILFLGLGILFITIFLLVALIGGIFVIPRDIFRYLSDSIGIPKMLSFVVTIMLSPLAVAGLGLSIPILVALVILFVVILIFVFLMYWLFRIPLTVIKTYILQPRQFIKLFIGVYIFHKTILNIAFVSLIHPGNRIEINKTTGDVKVIK